MSSFVVVVLVVLVVLIVLTAVTVVVVLAVAVVVLVSSGVYMVDVPLLLQYLHSQKFKTPPRYVWTVSKKP